MTNFEHLESAEGALKNANAHTLAHVVQDAREEITELRAKNADLKEQVKRLKRGLAEGITTLQNAACDTY